MERNSQQIIESTAKELFSLLGIEADIVVSETEDGADVVIETAENGMLIGYHGETLEALQLILSLCVAKKVGSFIRLSVEVGSYKQQRMDYLEKLVAQTKEQVLSERKAIAIPDLKSWERRFVHMVLKEDGDVTTESSGQGRDRVLTVYPRE